MINLNIYILCIKHHRAYDYLPALTTEKHQFSLYIFNSFLYIKITYDFSSLKNAEDVSQNWAFLPMSFCLWEVW